MDPIEYDSNQQTIDAVNLLKTAILQSQARAAKAVNQEQLALYYGVGRFLSLNTRKKGWGSGMIKSISQRLRSEMPGIRGFGETNLRNMRMFYEVWSTIESNSSVRLMNLDNFPAVSFLSVSFTQHGHHYSRKRMG